MYGSPFESMRRNTAKSSSTLRATTIAVKSPVGSEDKSFVSPIVNLHRPSEETCSLVSTKLPSKTNVPDPRQLHGDPAVMNTTERASSSQFAVPATGVRDPLDVVLVVVDARAPSTDSFPVSD
jgi:hypothetical protein